MSISFAEILEDLIDREGAYVNDPDDLGGPTKYGITLATLSEHRRRGVQAKDVANLTKAEAREIYKSRYYYAPNIDGLPDIMIASVFDMYVNAGRNAIKLLQKTLNGFGAHLDCDGIIGPFTLEAVHQITSFAGQYCVDAYAIERREYYYSLGDKRAQSRKYARRRDGGKGGWIKRAETFMSKRYHYTIAQHKSRIAHW